MFSNLNVPIACEPALVFKFRTQALPSGFSLRRASEFTKDAHLGTNGSSRVSLGASPLASQAQNTRACSHAKRSLQSNQPRPDQQNPHQGSLDLLLATWYHVGRVYRPQLLQHRCTVKKNTGAERTDYNRVHGTSFHDKMYSAERLQHEVYLYTNSFSFHSSLELCTKLQLTSSTIHQRIGTRTVKAGCFVLMGTLAKLLCNVPMLIGSLSSSVVVSTISGFHFLIQRNNISFLRCWTGRNELPYGGQFSNRFQEMGGDKMTKIAKLGTQLQLVEQIWILTYKCLYFSQSVDKPWSQGNYFLRLRHSSIISIYTGRTETETCSSEFASKVRSCFEQTVNPK